VAVRLSPKLLPALLVLGLVALGIPQTADSVLWWLTGDSPDQLGAASPATAASARHNAQLLERAYDWFGDGRAEGRAGILRLRLATERPAGIDKAELDNALNDLTTGLKHAPANAIGWAALAQAQLAADDSAKAHAALTTSLLLDEHDPQLALWRCALGLALWDKLSQDDRRLWNAQVAMAWDRDPQGLVALARHNGGVYTLPIRLSFLPDQSRLREFDRLLGVRH